MLCCFITWVLLFRSKFWQICPQLTRDKVDCFGCVLGRAGLSKHLSNHV